MARKNTKKGYDVITVGSATIDCFINLPTDFKNIKHGSKIVIKDIHLLTGGGGTNVGVGLSRLGLKTGFIGEVGEDHSAHLIKKDLEHEGVDFIVKQHSRHLTAYSVILESKGQDRSILVYRGASDYLQPDEIDKKKLKTGWFYFGSAMDASMKTMDYLANHARKNSINVYFNPSSYMVKLGQKALSRILAATKIIAMNKEEAQMLLKNRSGDVKKLLKEMQDLGPEICIITDGKRGVDAYDGIDFYSLKAHEVTAVDTTGAGDAFGTGFLAGIIMKKNLDRKKRIGFAMKLGIVNSESVIRYVGTKKGLLSKRQALADMKKLY
ncbi:MAG: carbohydrate kinase family protein [Candidatus Woesearchaeota archaeon]